MKIQLPNRLQNFIKKTKLWREKEKNTSEVYKEKAEREAARCGMTII